MCRCLKKYYRSDVICMFANKQWDHGDVYLRTIFALFVFALKKFRWTQWKSTTIKAQIKFEHNLSAYESILYAWKYHHVGTEKKLHARSFLSLPLSKMFYRNVSCSKSNSSLVLAQLRFFEFIFLLHEIKWLHVVNWGPYKCKYWAFGMFATY